VNNPWEAVRFKRSRRPCWRSDRPRQVSLVALALLAESACRAPRFEIQLRLCSAAVTRTGIWLKTLHPHTESDKYSGSKPQT